MSDLNELSENFKTIDDEKVDKSNWTVAIIGGSFALISVGFAAMVGLGPHLSKLNPFSEPIQEEI
jgi:hypothetical protein